MSNYYEINDDLMVGMMTLGSEDHRMSSSQGHCVTCMFQGKILHVCVSFLRFTYGTAGE